MEVYIVLKLCTKKNKESAVRIQIDKQGSSSLMVRAQELFAPIVTRIS